MRAYQEILRLPGALRFCLAALLARSGNAMTAMGLLLMVSALYDSYTWAGALAAVEAAAWAVGAAFLASRVDRLGQRRVMWPAVIVANTALTVVLVLAILQAPVWALLPGTLVAGFFGGSPGAMVRTRWSHVTSDAQQLHTAYALESTLDELTFIVGPVVVTALSTQLHPAAGLVAPIVAGLFGGHLFYSQRATEPPLVSRPVIPADPQARLGTRLAALGRRLILLTPGVGPVVAVNVLVGCFFGAFDVSVVAATSAWGVRHQAGLLLAACSFGSAVAGFAYGSRGWHSPLTRRFVIFVVAMTATASTLLIVPSAFWLALAGLFIGATIAPSLINANSLLTRVAPADRLTEGLAWLGTSLGLGVAFGSAVTGRIVDQAGHVGAFQVSVSFAAGAALIAVTSVGVIRRATATSAAA